MKRTILTGATFVFLLTATAVASLDATIIYQTSELGGGRWQYMYEVTNNSLTVPIEEFTIWFDYDLYTNLAVETPTSPSGRGPRVFSRGGRCLLCARRAATER